MKRIRIGVSAITAFALVGGSVAAMTAAPADAAAPVQKCAKASGTAAFAPGLTNTPKNNVITAKGTLTGCAPVAATGGSGTLVATIKVTAGSCAKLATGKQKLSGTASTKWKNGKTSKYTLTFTTGTGSTATTATITGKVSSGLFVGKKVSAAVKFTIQGTPNCSESKPVKAVKFAQAKPFQIL